MIQDLPSDYKLTDGEIDNIVYLTCKYTANWPMRQADLAVCKALTGEGTGPQHLEKLVRTTCEYVWDHICGEPDETSPDDFYNHIAPLITNWFSNTTQEERTNTQ